jgi:hypothetical protein
MSQTIKTASGKFQFDYESEDGGIHARNDDQSHIETGNQSHSEINHNKNILTGVSWVTVRIKRQSKILIKRKKA